MFVYFNDNNWVKCYGKMSEQRLLNVLGRPEIILFMVTEEICWQEYSLSLKWSLNSQNCILSKGISVIIFLFIILNVII